MPQSSVTVKNVDEVVRSMRLHRLKFGHARYLLHRALETKTLEGFQFARPMLEVGIGDGHITSLFFEQTIDYGVDIKLHDQNYYFVYRNVAAIDAVDNRLPFADGLMASIFSMSVLEHVRKLDDLLSECRRVLKPGGVFVANVNSDKCKQVVPSSWDKACPNLFSAAEWTAVFEKAGLTTFRIVPALPPWLYKTLDTVSLIRGIHRPFIHRFLSPGVWAHLYSAGTKPGSIDEDLTLTFFCEKT